MFWLKALHPYSIRGFWSHLIPMKLTNEHRWGQSPLPDLKTGQNLDFLQLGQRRLGTSGVVMVDIKVVPIGPLSCLELSGTVYC